MVYAQKYLKYLEIIKKDFGIFTMVPTWLLIHPRVACHGPQHPHHKATGSKQSKVAQFLFSTVETFDSKSSSEWVLDSHCQFDKECQKR
jgi:hypothetical protein